MAAQLQSESEVATPTLVETSGRAPAERLRVLHVVPRLGLGGTEHGVLKVLAGLGDDQFEHRICAVRGMDASFVRGMNVAVRTYSAASAKSGFQFPLFRLIRIMKEFRPHIVHTRNFGALEAICAARLARVPVAIHSEHGYELEILGGLPIRRRILCRALFPMADAVFAVTRELSLYHSRQSWLPAGAFRVIHNGVSTERFAPRHMDAAEIRNQLGIPTERFVIGSVGRLVPIKDHLTLLRAVEVVLRRRKDVHVLLVGDGPERAKLEEYAAASPELTGHVTFCGASGRIPELMNAMQVFVLPSICEGMSNTILEAMASGLPLVVTRAGGNPELVVDGSIGFLFPPSDFPALAQHLEMLAESPDLRRSFGEAARLRAVEQFSLERMIRSYRDLYFEFGTKRNALHAS
jgi:sugar transferase (PEP-CTERM/EpsH1 system associated)